MTFTALLVDDDDVVLSTLKSVFETRDFEVSTAVSASDAICEMTKRSFDLVVTDMRMETETAGFDVVRHAKATGNPTAVVVLSAYPIPSSAWRKAGADAAFMKGGGIFRILDDIERLVNDHSRRRPAAS
jgi:ActR/RegA family two-component response regulator